MITVSFVDDDQMLLDGLAAWLSSVPDLRLLGTMRTVEELLAAPGARPRVVVLDLLLADRSDPVENVRRLVAADIQVLVASVVPHVEHGVDVVRAGALGYLTKDHALDVLADAIRQVATGETVYSTELAYSWSRDTRPERPRLAAQERAVLVAYASGMTLTAAARRAGVQPATAKKYLAKVKEKYRELGRATYTKLDLANRVREDGLARYPQS
ncbi:DNA-binding NarL/FixJ family response regulator [Actinoalloteichus hoggarensis]|uniref:Transcriptional regulatory protein DevR (DosR) n=1 Tax=Actinoalloteichus hoggarensis TaxID=1470176 RepID=A0A221W2W5_9PSEU|nr:response regulator transcription factor [Actinoalloteichus hoggarensis]ASO20053.1 Transcriptional regulatory protein DevR (DosR) [Actinoalloteichus hoggarensis]MBB5919236.1 DNA-binding NarL/FixJ family response regulator [Actinoalloteichus hoggarensis]